MVSGNSCPAGNGWSGKPSCQRIIMAIKPPKSRNTKLINRNWMPMIL